MPATALVWIIVFSATSQFNGAIAPDAPMFADAESCESVRKTISMERVVSRCINVRIVLPLAVK